MPFETPGAVERAERLGAVAAMIYLIFNEGYSASGGEAHVRASLCEEAIRLARLLLRLFPAEPEIMGLAALLLLQHARAPARLDADGAIVLLEDQDRSLWNRAMIAEGLALIDKAMRHRRPGPYQVQAAIAALHARAARPKDTDWAQIDPLYGSARAHAALARRHAQPRGRRLQGAGPAAALAMIEPLAPQLSGYFYFFGVKGALLLQLGRSEEARSRLRPGDRARQYGRRGGPYPHAYRPAGPQRRSDTTTGTARPLRPRSSRKKINWRCRIARPVRPRDRRWRQRNRPLTGGKGETHGTQPYLNFDGKCAAAFKFYERVLGGKIITMMTSADMPGGEMGTEPKTRSLMPACSSATSC